MKLLFSFFIVSTTLSSLSAFSFISSSRPTTRTTFTTSAQSTSELSAIIYGWDGDDESDHQSSSTSSLGYLDTESDVGFGACTPAGINIAEHLNTDRDRTGSFARLAVAFSPPERGIKITDLERVDVVCVRDNQIELEAILCEDGGCVSLSIPIQFPNDCGEWFETGCVMRNLDELDGTAESTLQVLDHQASQQLSDADLEELCQLNDKVEYPSWWIPPECDANLAADCENIRRLMNQEDFAVTIAALAQDGLDHAGHGSLYRVQRAKIAAVGPAGMCLKVGVKSVNKVEGFEFLDVMYPFGGEPVRDAESLRAVVLGAVAAAEEKM